MQERRERREAAHLRKEVNEGFAKTGLRNYQIALTHAVEE